jgi:hypothetical protein
MIAKWSEILLLSKMRRLGLTQPALRTWPANGAYSLRSVSALSVFLTVAR